MKRPKGEVSMPTLTQRRFDGDSATFGYWLMYLFIELEGLY